MRFTRPRSEETSEPVRVETYLNLPPAAFLASASTLDPALNASIASLIAPGPAAEADLMQATLTGSAAVIRIAVDRVAVLTGFTETEPFTPEEAACDFRVLHPKSGSCPGATHQTIQDSFD